MQKERKLFIRTTDFYFQMMTQYFYFTTKLKNRTNSYKVRILCLAIYADYICLFLWRKKKRITVEEANRKRNKTTIYLCIWRARGSPLPGNCENEVSRWRRHYYVTFPSLRLVSPTSIDPRFSSMNDFVRHHQKTKKTKGKAEENCLPILSLDRGPRVAGAN